MKPKYELKDLKHMPEKKIIAKALINIANELNDLVKTNRKIEKKIFEIS